MVLYIIDHPYHYEAENLCRVFYPFDKVTVQHEFMPSDENRTVYTAEENGEYIVRIEDADGKTERKAKVGAETNTAWCLYYLMHFAPTRAKCRAGAC